MSEKTFLLILIALIWTGICISKNLICRLIRIIAFVYYVRFFFVHGIKDINELLNVIVVICLIFLPIIVANTIKLIRFIANK